VISAQVPSAISVAARAAASTPVAMVISWVLAGCPLNKGRSAGRASAGTVIFLPAARMTAFPSRVCSCGGKSVTQATVSGGPNTPKVATCLVLVRSRWRVVR
jgi:hypothetical protein